MADGTLEEVVEVVGEANEKPMSTEPAFRVLTEQRILVSKFNGQLWKSRRDEAVKFRQKTGLTEAWKQANDYYHNDQLNHRADSDGSGLSTIADKIDSSFVDTENLVFANVSAAVPALYAKNPDCTVTTEDDSLKAIANLGDKLADQLLRRRNSPGVNAKPKIRRAVTSAFLHNLGWVEVGWVNKDEGVEQARVDLDTISKKLSNPKTNKNELRELEGQLLALERRINVLSPSGPFVKYHKVDRIYRDPLSVEEDLSDANWIMVQEDWLTSVLNAMYYKKEGTQNKSIFQPTHTVSDNEEGSDEDVNNFNLFASTEDEGEDKYENYLRSTTDKYVTKVWRVWDKATRRVYLYHDKDWSWPIWVYDDPYQFEDFFPYVPLSFYTSPRGGESKGEVSYYLDQQDTINFINSITNKARLWAATKIVYNSDKITDGDFKRMMYSNAFEGMGVKIPDGMTLKDVFASLDLPILSNPQLLDKSGLYATIDRIGSVSDILRGQQFKTNTTNEAIAQYSQVNQTRFDSPIDAIEDFIGIICQKLLQLSFMYMDKTQVSALIGPQLATTWRNLSLEEFRSLSIEVTGGSTQKPTSQTKKQLALEVGQVLGQFASANPLVVIVMLRVLSEAFNEVSVTDQEWQMLIATTQQALMQATAGAGGPPEEETPPVETEQPEGTV